MNFDEEPPDEEPVFEPIEPPQAVSTAPRVDIRRDLSTMTVRLPPIPSEDLEHADDPWLDNAYELKIAA